MTHEWKERGQKLVPTAETVQRSRILPLGYRQRFYTPDWRSCVRCGCEREHGEAYELERVRHVRESDQVRYALHICCHTSLDDFPKKHWGDARKLLAAIVAAGNRFSTFDVPVVGPGAKTLTSLFHGLEPWAKSVEGTVYPWTHIELTDAGRRALFTDSAVPTEVRGE